MKFILGDNTRWFKFPDEDGEVCLKILDVEDIKNIRKQTSIKMVEHKLVNDGNVKRPETFTYTEVDDDLEMDLYIDAIIVDWKNIYLGDNELECSKVNKLFLFKKVSMFRNFINDCVEELNKLEKAEQAQAEKN